MTIPPLPSPTEIIQLAKTDPRWVPYTRKDGWGAANRVRPDPNSDTGWLCPDCGRNTTVTYGQGPRFENGRYIRGTDDRVCRDCWDIRDNERKLEVA